MSDRQAIGAVVGGVIGFVATGFNPLGAAKGAYWGYALGSAFTKTELDAAEGPRMEDRTFQTSSYGEYIPRVYGTEKLSGNIFWLEGNRIQETKNTQTVEQGGKGGGGSSQVQTTYTYSVTMAVMICEGPISGIRRIWADNILFYDNTGDNVGNMINSHNAMGDMEVFLGTSTQLPSTTIEQEKGAGNVPAYRGKCYVVFRNLQLAEYGNRIPNLQFEVVDNLFDDESPQPMYYVASVGTISTDVGFYPVVSSADSGLFAADHGWRQVLPWHYDNGVMHFIRSSLIPYEIPSATGINGSYLNPTSSIYGSTTSVSRMPWNYFTSKSVNDFNTILSAERFDTYPWDLPGGCSDYSKFTIRPVDNSPNIFLASYYNDIGVQRLAFGIRLSNGKISYRMIAETPIQVFETSSGRSAICTLHTHVNCSQRDGIIYLCRRSGNLFADQRGYLFAYDVSDIGSSLPRNYYGYFGVDDYKLGAIRHIGVTGPYYHVDNNLYDGTSIFSGDNGNNKYMSFGVDTFGASIYVINSNTKKINLYDERLNVIASEIDLTSVFAGYTNEVNRQRFAVRGNIIYFKQLRTTGSRDIIRKIKLDHISNTATLIEDLDVTPYGAATGFDYSIIDINYNTFYHGGIHYMQSTMSATPDPGGIVFINKPSVIGTTFLPESVLQELNRIDVISSSDYDITGISSDVVRGYKISNPSPISSVLKVLQQGFRFDVYEEDYKIKFRSRATATSSATIPSSDLRAHEAGSSAPPQALQSIKNPNDIPGRVEINYISQEKDYEDGFAYADRLSTARNTISGMDLPLVMTADDAYKTAEILLLDAEREGRGAYEISLPFKYSHLERGKLITVTTDYETLLLRIVSIEKGAPGLVKIAAVEDATSDYSSSAVGYAGLVTTQTIRTNSPTSIIFLDLPALSGDHNDPGFYWALSPMGESSGWHGATLYKSSDSGTSWDVVETGLTYAPNGVASNLLTDDVYTIFSYSQTLNVTFSNGVPETKTEEQVRNGANMAAYGRPGSWEIIKFISATLVSGNIYDLKGLLRGQYGTEWAMSKHQLGDFVVMLSRSYLHRSTLNEYNYNLDQLFLPLTIGAPFTDKYKVGNTGNGVSMRPHAPGFIRATRNSSMDITISWVARGRYNFEWVAGSEPPNTDVDVFVVEIMSGLTVLRTLTSVAGTHSVIYTSSMQVTDWGANKNPVTIRMYQQGTLITRGYDAIASL